MQRFIWRTFFSLTPPQNTFKIFLSLTIHSSLGIFDKLCETLHQLSIQVLNTLKNELCLKSGDF